MTFELGSINTIDLVDAVASLNITQIVEVEELKPSEALPTSTITPDGEEADGENEEKPE